ncbi:MAG: 2-phosphosulfolactate phosphatase [Fervidobacterium sp.]
MIYTFFTYQEVSKNIDQIGNMSNIFDIVVVIDVLRATSTIVTALANGAKAIFTFESAEKVLELKKIREANSFKALELPIVFGGERAGIKIKGFDLGNSPLEYSTEDIQGKIVFLTTTNGTKALNMAFQISSNVYLSSFLNLSSTVKALEDYDNIAIICAGNEGNPSYEDTQVAGKIIYEIQKSKNVELSDTSKIAFELWKSLKKPDFFGEHAGKLRELGFDSDLEFCQRTDYYNINAKALAFSEEIAEYLLPSLLLKPLKEIIKERFETGAGIVICN